MPFAGRFARGIRPRVHHYFARPGAMCAQRRLCQFDINHCRLQERVTGSRSKRGQAGLFQRNEQGFGAFGATVALSLDQSLPVPHDLSTWRGRAAYAFDRAHQLDLVPDLGTDIGTAQWFRGLATCIALCGTTVALAPGIHPLIGRVPTPLEGRALDENRAQSIAPLAYGANTGKRMAATDLATPIDGAPERPTIDLTATIGQGDGFARVLERAGVSPGEASRAAGMVASVTPLSSIEPGTVMSIVLGPRASQRVARPLQSLDVRARFDLKVRISSAGGHLQMVQMPVQVDSTPLRVVGQVGDSLYRSARAAGVPATTVQSLIRALSPKVDFDSDLPANARFDVIVEHKRAETGETQTGNLLYIGLDRNGRTLRMLPWKIGGATDWYDAAGVGQRRAGMVRPVTASRVSSGFGMRFHPLLGYSRFHKGTDYAAVTGTPIHAVTDGTVQMAGWGGGYGNMVKLAHGRGLGSGYAHMSRILVRSGQTVTQGQIIGYVGSTGLSTGPHLHFEVYRNGVAVSPGSVLFESTSLLSGRELDAFRARLRGILATPVAGVGQR